MANSKTNVDKESKELFLHIKENEDKFIDGDLDLNVTLQKTDELFKIASAEKTTVSAVFQDSGLIQLQARIAKARARAFQVDTVVFNPRVFCEKVKDYFSPNDVSNNNKRASSTKRKACPEVWEKLGEYSIKDMNTVPTFSFIYGTFDADPVEIVKRVRKQAPIDKTGKLTKPEAVNPGALQNDQDMMLNDANRVYSIFKHLIKKSEKQVLCFYEFITDPLSFTRTVENCFLVSFLVKHGHIGIVSDQQGLPCLIKLEENKDKDSWNSECNQSVLTISMEDWQNIVKTFKFKTPLIPPRGED